MKSIAAKLAGLAALVAAALQSACAYEDYSGGGGRYYADGSAPPDDPHYASWRYYMDQCGKEKHDRNVAGAVAGAVVGGLIGNAVTHGGGRAGGTVIGAAAGAAVGSNIARSTVNCKGGRPYWTYDETVDYDAYAGYPGRHEAGWYHEHNCRWAHTDRDDWVRVCRGPGDAYYPEY
jgi:hypothetical protein